MRMKKHQSMLLLGILHGPKRVVTMFNHKAIEASCKGERKYILVPGPQAVELIGTEPSIGPQSYLAVKHTEDSIYYFQFIGSVMMKTITPTFHYYNDLIH